MIRKAEKPPRDLGLVIAEGGDKSALRNLNSAIVVSGPDAETSAAISQIATGASDKFPVAMQQLEKSPVGSPAANEKQTATKEPFEEDR